MEQLNSLRQLQETDNEIVHIQHPIASQSAEDSAAKAKLSKLMKDRESLAEKIEFSFLTQYEKIQFSTAGSVLAVVEDGQCKSCNLRLLSNLYHKIQVGAVLCTCPHYARILPAGSTDIEEAEGSKNITIGEH